MEIMSLYLLGLMARGPNSVLTYPTRWSLGEEENQSLRTFVCKTGDVGRGIETRQSSKILQHESVNEESIMGSCCGTEKEPRQNKCNTKDSWEYPGPML
jgi:hypothetical protein